MIYKSDGFKAQGGISLTSWLRQLGLSLAQFSIPSTQTLTYVYHKYSYVRWESSARSRHHPYPSMKSIVSFRHPRTSIQREDIRLKDGQVPGCLVLMHGLREEICAQVFVCPKVAQYPRMRLSRTASNTQ